MIVKNANTGKDTLEKDENAGIDTHDKDKSKST